MLLDRRHPCRHVFGMPAGMPAAQLKISFGTYSIRYLDPGIDGRIE